MPFAGRPHEPQHPGTVRRERSDVAALRDYPLSELQDLLTTDEILLAHAHHVGKKVFELLTHPLPEEIAIHNQPGATALTHNTIDFDEEAPGTEDVIEADPLIKEIFRLPSDERRAALLRARRSILGYLILTHSLPQSGVA